MNYTLFAGCDFSENSSVLKVRRRILIRSLFIYFPIRMELGAGNPFTCADTTGRTV